MPESEAGQSQLVQEVPPVAASDPVLAKTILVFGDAAIDWYEEKRDFPIRNVEAQALPSPELPRGWIWHETPGGCLLLDRMIHRLLGKTHKVVSPVSLRGDVKRTKPPREIYGHNDTKPVNNSGYLHSLALIDSFKSKQNPDEAQWRVSKFLGFNIAAGPAEQKPAVQPLTYPDAKASETEHADVLGIDDAGWSFRHNEMDDGGRPVWPRLLAASVDPPVTTGPLFSRSAVRSRAPAVKRARCGRESRLSGIVSTMS
jgi:hypothetical protein